MCWLLWGKARGTRAQCQPGVLWCSGVVLSTVWAAVLCCAVALASCLCEYCRACVCVRVCVSLEQAPRGRRQGPVGSPLPKGAVHPVKYPEFQTKPG